MCSTDLTRALMPFPPGVFVLVSGPEVHAMGVAYLAGLAAHVGLQPVMLPPGSNGEWWGRMAGAVGMGWWAIEGARVYEPFQSAAYVAWCEAWPDGRRDRKLHRSQSWEAWEQEIIKRAFTPG
jgi:hypothetical protein